MTKDDLTRQVAELGNLRQEVRAALRHTPANIALVAKR
jgi:hypothetical protein